MPWDRKFNLGSTWENENKIIRNSNRNLIVFRMEHVYDIKCIPSVLSPCPGYPNLSCEFKKLAKISCRLFFVFICSHKNESNSFDRQYIFL